MVPRVPDVLRVQRRFIRTNVVVRAASFVQRDWLVLVVPRWWRRRIRLVTPLVMTVMVAMVMLVLATGRAMGVAVAIAVAVVGEVWLGAWVDLGGVLGDEGLLNRLPNVRHRVFFCVCVCVCLFFNMVIGTSERNG